MFLIIAANAINQTRTATVNGYRMTINLLYIGNACQFDKVGKLERMHSIYNERPDRHITSITGNLFTVIDFG